MGSLGSLGLWGLFWGTFLSATIFPFSSDALFLAALAASERHLACLIVASLGNWLGGVTTYWMGRLGRWEWLERWFKVKKETLEKQKAKIDRYGVWMALLSWVPVIGDVIALALGFYKARPLWTMILLLVGKAGRFVCWALLVGAL